MVSTKTFPNITALVRETSQKDFTLSVQHEIFCTCNIYQVLKKIFHVKTMSVTSLLTCEDKYHTSYMLSHFIYVSKLSLFSQQKFFPPTLLSHIFLPFLKISLATIFRRMWGFLFLILRI